MCTRVGGCWAAAAVRRQQHLAASMHAQGVHARGKRTFLPLGPVVLLQGGRFRSCTAAGELLQGPSLAAWCCQALGVPRKHHARLRHH